MTVMRHWLVLPVDPEGEPFIAWGSVEADEYRRQSAVYRVEEYVCADQLRGAVSEPHAIEAIGWLSAELAARADAWNGNAPGWFPEPPEWLELWQRALAATGGQ